LIRNLLDQAALSELDRRYWAFVETLPSHLAQLAADRKIAAGEGPSTPLRTVAELGVAVSGPWAFRDTFPSLAEEQLLNLGEAWIFLILSVVLRDHLADSQLPLSPDTVELQQRLMTKTRDVFRSSVGSQPIFWQRFEQYEQQVVSALQLEAGYRALPDETYDLTTAWQIGTGKSALFKAIPCAMAVLCEAMPRFAQQELSIDALAAGRQLLDDVIDWQEDLARGHYTYPLAQVLSHLKEAGEEVSPQAIESKISNSTILEDALTQVRAWYHQALTEVEGIPCQVWTDFVRYSMAECTWYHRWLIIHRIAEAARQKARTVQREETYVPQ
jgi:hypothetical protein